MPKRVVETCSPDTECSDEEISALVEEHRLVENDPDIQNFEHPSLEEMKVIIEQAEKYTGEWYHAQVTLPFEPYQNDEYSKLWNRIDELGKDSGLYMLYEFDTDEDGNLEQEIVEQD